MLPFAPPDELAAPNYTLLFLSFFRPKLMQYENSSLALSGWYLAIIQIDRTSYRGSSLSSDGLLKHLFHST